MLNIYVDQAIREFREQGFSCVAIARACGRSKDSVMKYCQRHNIKPNTKRKTKKENAKLGKCEYCGAPIYQSTSRKRFCSDYCRTRAWRKSDYTYMKRHVDTQIMQKRLAFISKKSDE